MPYKFKDIKKKLIKLGFVIKRQKGSHVVFFNEQKGVTFPVPQHGNKNISIGVENKLYKVLNIKRDEFRNL